MSDVASGKKRWFKGKED